MFAHTHTLMINIVCLLVFFSFSFNVQCALPVCTYCHPCRRDLLQFPMYFSVFAAASVLPGISLIERHNQHVHSIYNFDIEVPVAYVLCSKGKNMQKKTLIIKRVIEYKKLRTANNCQCTLLLD